MKSENISLRATLYISPSTRFALDITFVKIVIGKYIMFSNNLIKLFRILKIVGTKIKKTNEIVIIAEVKKTLDIFVSILETSIDKCFKTI
ncbi:hypothetical protein VAE308_180016 [Vibrio aestuarianus]|nr:hypothetical protein VAE308_180016 [Vibrio aestuarianus]